MARRRAARAVRSGSHPTSRSSRKEPRSTRTGSNLKIGIHDTGGTTIEIAPNITSQNVYQEVVYGDMATIDDADKDEIDQVVITVLNADVENTFYIDNMRAQSPAGWRKLAKGADGQVLMLVDGLPAWTDQ